MKRSRFVFHIFGLAFLVTACQFQLVGSGQSTPTPAESTLQTPGETTDALGSMNAPSSPVVEPILFTPTLEIKSAKPDATATPDPLRYTLPTPGPVPVSAWRPPLYPVPWSLTPNDHFYFARPIAADEVNWPLPQYRYGAINFGPDVPHTGVDIVAPEGTSVLAAGPGTVEKVGYGIYRGLNDPSDPYGLAVVIRHDFGYKGEPLFSVYGHLSETQVIPGQRVATGDVIALSGETGLTTGPHLHFEVRVGESTYWTTRNPELWLAPPQGWGVLVGRATNSWGQLLTSPQNRDEIEEQNDGSRLLVTNIETGQRWWIDTYGTEQTIREDDYYRENLVLSDLPAGEYELSISYLGLIYTTTVEIYPGAVSYFRFYGRGGFFTNPLKPPMPTTVPIYEP